MSAAGCTWLPLQPEQEIQMSMEPISSHHLWRSHDPFLLEEPSFWFHVMKVYFCGTGKAI